ncbi:MAG: TolC family protein, partial [Bacteroidales bacterium]|nr:TolC family protein [Bacteroidales bacterium]
MKIKISILLLFFALISVNLDAQQKLILSLESARKHALDHNKYMQNADFAMEKSQLAVREAIANGLPQLNASMDYSNALGAKISIRFNESMPASEIDIKPQSNFYLNVNQLVFSGNYIVGVQMSRLAQDLSRLGYQKTELEVISSVTDAYYMVLIAGESKAIIKQNLENLKNLYKKTAALAEVGIIEKTDVDQLFVQMNSLQNALSSAERQAELAANLLRLQLGAGIETEIELTDNLSKLMEDAEIENMLITQFKVEDNIDFRMMQQQEYMTKKMVDMQKSNALPTLAAFYRYTHKLIKPDFDMTPSNMVGLQMNIPIFSSGVRNAQTKQALIDLKTTQNNKSLLVD